MSGVELTRSPTPPGRPLVLTDSAASNSTFSYPRNGLRSHSSTRGISPRARRRARSMMGGGRPATTALDDPERPRRRVEPGGGGANDDRSGAHGELHSDR